YLARVGPTTPKPIEPRLLRSITPKRATPAEQPRRANPPEVSGTGDLAAGPAGEGAASAATRRARGARRWLPPPRTRRRPARSPPGGFPVDIADSFQKN